jgi:phospho-N-acetylmuramoyl-pentapeptide-transferase
LPPDTPPALFSQLSVLVFGLVAFLLTVLTLPFYIRWVKRRQIEQFLREEGPESHAAKAHTPTTGGAWFMLTILLCSFAWLYYRHGYDIAVLLVMCVAFSCGLLGLVDDLAKVQKKANRGISARFRLIAEALIGLAFAFVLISIDKAFIVMPTFHGTPTSLHESIPEALYLFLGAFLVAATTNALNLHDGMDGLAAGTSALVLITFSVMFSALGNFGLAALSSIGAGSLCAFLVFNRYPAKIFMGDTGSLFIGGLLAALTLSGGLIFWFVPLAFIYIAETLSVMMQVVWFKLTKSYTPEKPMSSPALIWLKLTKRLPGEGRRLFAMAPLHHHFEALFQESGVAEWQIVAGFWLVQMTICLFVLVLFFKL